MTKKNKTPIVRDYHQAHGPVQISMTNDYLFKALMQRNERVLKALVCALLHLEFTGITIIRMDRNPGAIALPCLELGNDGKHIHGASYHRLADM